MKKKLLGLLIAIKIFANENWIPINSMNKTETRTLDINLSQIKPINKILKNAMVVKTLIDATSKKEKPITNDKNWFDLTVP